MKKYELNKIRPRLRAVAPLTFWISVGFVWANLLIYWLLAHVPTTAIKQNLPPIVATPAMFKVWGYWFLFIALLMAYSLFNNNWKLLRTALVLGLVSKLTWTYALLWMIFHGYSVFATFILWLFLAWVQAWTIVFFSPTIADDHHKILPENERFKP